MNHPTVKEPQTLEQLQTYYESAEAMARAQAGRPAAKQWQAIAEHRHQLLKEAKK